MPGVLGPKLFTLEEARALLPFVRGRLARFQELVARYESVRRDLSIQRLVASSGGDSENPDVVRLTELETSERDLMESMREVQQEFLEAGVVPKSFQDGLVDFFALRGGRLVFLCWRQGERTIRAWHPLEGGLAGRRPISSFRRRPREPRDEG